MQRPPAGTSICAKDWLCRG